MTAEEMFGAPDVSTSPLEIIAGEPGKTVRVGDIEIQCYVLEGGIRVLSQAGFLRALGRHPRISSKFNYVSLPPFLAARNLQPYLPQIEDPITLVPIPFKAPGSGRVVYGYAAELFMVTCRVYRDAMRSGALRADQIHIGTRALAFLEAFIDAAAMSGWIGVIDEATGYTTMRPSDEMVNILNRWLAAYLQPWTKTFPREFFDQIFRLHGWRTMEGEQRPSIVGHYINDIVYSRLAPGLLEELRERNPERRHKHHQHLTPDWGHPRLVAHLNGVTALMRAALTWEGFHRSLTRAFPRYDEQTLMPIDEC